ncbi:uncharacterized protein [Spinacia oleracea]|uniref:Reverse transcriptase domain-containing protein n=1 Tax=Spinacia oleracea TaxID=3562 RepID=A0A9R0HWF6_SPIOL|nr:uncharacterized protein LOC110776870 [Spinacia oleracea]
MEYLSHCLEVVSSSTAFKLHPRCQKLGVTHLMFAADLLMFCKADSVKVMFDAFNKFSEASGLVANLHKSEVYVAGISDTEGNHIVETLGIPKGFVMPKKVMKEIQRNRVFHWTGGDSNSRRAPVAWDQMCLPKVCGGWNLKDLTIWNKAAVIKHCWALSLKQDRLWIKWVHIYYIKQKDFWSMSIPSGLTWTFKEDMAK